MGNLPQMDIDNNVIDVEMQILMSFQQLLLIYNLIHTYMFLFVNHNGVGYGNEVELIFNRWSTKSVHLLQVK